VRSFSGPRDRLNLQSDSLVVRFDLRKTCQTSQLTLVSAKGEFRASSHQDMQGVSNLLLRLVARGSPPAESIVEIRLSFACGACLALRHPPNTVGKPIASVLILELAWNLDRDMTIWHRLAPRCRSSPLRYVGVADMVRSLRELQPRRGLGGALWWNFGCHWAFTAPYS
jgi:hypothetical protein